MRTTEKVTVRETKHARYSYIVRWPGGDGKRAEKFFKNETESLKWAKDRRFELGEEGEIFGSISPAERSAVMFWRSFVKSATSRPPDLLAVLQEYAAKWRVQRSSVTVSTALDGFLNQQEVDGASERHLASLKSRVGRLNTDLGESLVAAVDHSAFTAWLNGLRATRADKAGDKLTLVTRENLKRSCRTFFAYCVRCGWMEINPVPIERKKRTREHRLANKKAPGILLPDQVQRFMQAVKTTAPQLLAFWSLKFFAGVRDAEVARMSWDMIDLESGEIHLPASITKTADQRTVKISANLREWLRLAVKKSGPIALMKPSAKDKETGPSRSTAMARRYGYKQVLKALVTKDPETAAPVPFVFPSNAARHCFGTYHLFAHREAGDTALQLGHKGDPGMLHEHYKNPTAEKHAAAFWDIFPDGKSRIPKNVVKMERSEKRKTAVPRRAVR